MRRTRYATLCCVGQLRYAGAPTEPMARCIYCISGDTVECAKRRLQSHRRYRGALYLSATVCVVPPVGLCVPLVTPCSKFSRACDLPQSRHSLVGARSPLASWVRTQRRDLRVFRRKSEYSPTFRNPCPIRSSKARAAVFLLIFNNAAASRQESGISPLLLPL